MKLIDGDRLLKLMAGGGDPDYAHHLETNLFPKCTLDPADLELAALGVLGELKKRLAKPGAFDLDSRVFDRTNSYTATVCDAIIKILTDLESAADLKAMQLIQVQAKAWKKMSDDAPAGAKRALLDHYYGQARAEHVLNEREGLALPTSAQGQKGGEKDESTKD